MSKEKKRLILLFTLLALVLIMVLGAKPLYNLYRDVSFSWTDHSDHPLPATASAQDSGFRMQSSPTAPPPT